MAGSQLRHSGKEVWHARAEDQAPHLSATPPLQHNVFLLFPMLAAVPCLVGGEEYEHLLSILSTRASSSSLNKAIWDLKVKIGTLYILQIVSEITSHL